MVAGAAELREPAWPLLAGAVKGMLRVDREVIIEISVQVRP
jgi:hypothetical protein